VIKTFKTIEEQIEILKSKGLVINYYEDAKEILLRENYFFVSGYRHLFMKSSKDRMFITGTTFEELYALFNFDRQLRNVFFKNLLIIENNCKSIFSYQMSKKYGIKEKNYLNPANFDQSSDKNRQINDLLKKIKRQIRMIIDKYKKLYSKNKDYIIIVRRNYINLNFAEAMDKYAEIIEKISHTKENI